MDFPIRDEGPVRFDADLPEAVDLVVIGGGVIGVCTALYAARDGLKVALLEKGRVAAEQSSRNWGWVRVQGRDMAEIPIALSAQTLWQELDAECKGALGLRQVGVSYFARTEKEMAGYCDWATRAVPLGATSRILTRQETLSMHGNPKADWLGALHTPTDMKAEPWQAVPRLAELAEDAGVIIKERCAVRGLDMQNGAVAGVVTEAGRVRAPRVVLAGGAWSSLFLRRHGVDIPQLSVRSSVMASGPLPQRLNIAGVDDTLAARPRDDGGYTLAPSAFAEMFIGPDAIRHIRRYLPLALSREFDVAIRQPAPRGWPDSFATPRRWRDDETSPFERMRVLNPPPNASRIRKLTRQFAELYPDMGAIEVARSWAGMIDVLPDVVPVVDRVEAMPGLSVCTGMCGHGFGIGPGFGKVMAALVQDRDCGFDLSRFSIARFSDGSKLRPGPNL